MNEYKSKQTNKQIQKAYPTLFLTDKDKKGKIWQAYITVPVP